MAVGNENSLEGLFRVGRMSVEFAMKERSYTAPVIVLMLSLGVIVTAAIMVLIVPVIMRVLSPLWFLP